MKRFLALFCLAALVLTAPAHAVELNLNAPSAILMEKETCSTPRTSTHPASPPASPRS